MTAFWGGIQIHLFHLSSSALNRNTLLLYQAEQCKLWHQAIWTPGHGYSLAGINEQLLCKMKECLYWIDRERKDKNKEAWAHVYISFWWIHVDKVLYLASLFYFIFCSHICFYTPFFIAILHCQFVFIADLSLCCFSLLLLPIAAIATAAIFVVSIAIAVSANCCHPTV
jgi:hypothetical protein